MEIKKSVGRPRMTAKDYTAEVRTMIKEKFALDSNGNVIHRHSAGCCARGSVAGFDLNGRIIIRMYKRNYDAEVIKEILST